VVRVSSGDYAELLHELDSGRKAVLLKRLHGDGQGCVIDTRLVTTALLDAQDGDLSEEARQMALEALHSGLPQVAGECDLTLAEPFFPQPRLVVLGGGHIALALVRLASRVGFQITVLDDRLEFANHERFPEAQDVICSSFAEGIARLPLGPATFAVIVTRGHLHDLTCLRALLSWDLAYLGMISSRRRARGTREVLLREGVSPQRLEKVRAPIGLAIGAVTPEEIAISILAQVIATRRLGGTGAAPSEFDRPVMEALARAEVSMVLVTLIACQGSTPRDPGARMLVWSDGRILGSIGGGLAEAQVMALAPEVAASGRFVTLRIDMTAEVAAEAGMVCGGSMDVLLEPFPMGGTKALAHRGVTA
jgi:xanthine dehydrogenase accessory factor